VPLLTEVETAKQIQVAPETLQQWRHHKRYQLPFVRVGRLIRYRQSDIDAWLVSRTVTSIEPRHFAAQRAKRKEHRSALKSAVKAVSRQPKGKAKRHSR
jgi:excisionase family DNA binding protein